MPKSRLCWKLQFAAGFSSRPAPSLISKVSSMCYVEVFWHLGRYLPARTWRDGAKVGLVIFDLHGILYTAHVTLQFQVVVVGVRLSQSARC